MFSAKLVASLVFPPPGGIETEQPKSTFHYLRSFSGIKTASGRRWGGEGGRERRTGVGRASVLRWFPRWDVNGEKVLKVSCPTITMIARKQHKNNITIRHTVFCCRATIAAAGFGLIIERKKFISPTYIHTYIHMCMYVHTYAYTYVLDFTSRL